MSKITESEIMQELSGVVDPDLKLTFEELSAIKKVEIDDDLIKIYLELVPPINWVAENVNNTIANVLEKIAPDMENEVIFSEKIIDTTNREFLKGVKNIIAVASGKGGVGKSAVASNIAAALSMTGAKVGMLDGDVYGPSQPTMFGLKDETLKAVEMPDGKTVAYPSEKFGIKVASMGFVLNRDEAAIVRGPLLAGYFSMLFEQVEWGPLDFLIFDLPPGTGDIQLTLTQKIPLTGAAIVTTPQEISLADVRRSIAMFKRVNVDILGIIENMSYFQPPDMPDKKYYIFGKEGGKSIAKEAEVPFLGEVPLDMKIRELNDGGKPYYIENKDNQHFNSIVGELIKQVRIHNHKIIEEPLTQISI